MKFLILDVILFYSSHIKKIQNNPPPPLQKDTPSLELETHREFFKILKAF